jgi:exodeoxyribonuclease VII small subunit
VATKDTASKDRATRDSATRDSGTSVPKSADFPDIADLTYEQSRDELISIVAQLEGGQIEGGQIGLENSMTLWQRGEALAAHCRTWLDGAEAKLTAKD